MTKQLYKEKPTKLEEVRGSSSQTIFSFMTGKLGLKQKDHPLDVDDWERNRALLLCYPEFHARLPEMASISPEWKRLVDYWDVIEHFYLSDYREYGISSLEKGSCDSLIKGIVSGHSVPVEQPKKQTIGAWLKTVHTKEASLKTLRDHVRQQLERKDATESMQNGYFVVPIHTFITKHTCGDLAELLRTLAKQEELVIEFTYVDYYGSGMCRVRAQ